MELFLREAAGPWAVLGVQGELDLHTSTSLRDRLRDLIDEGHARIAVDMTDVTFMDSSSLGVLVVAMKRLREKDGELSLIGVNGSPFKVLSLTGMDRVLSIYATPSELPRA